MARVGEIPRSCVRVLVLAVAVQRVGKDEVRFNLGAYLIASTLPRVPLESILRVGEAGPVNLDSGYAGA